MDKVTAKTKPVVKAKIQKEAKPKPASPQYWASLLMPMALIAVVG